MNLPARYRICKVVECDYYVKTACLSTQLAMYIIIHVYLCVLTISPKLNGYHHSNYLPAAIKLIELFTHLTHCHLPSPPPNSLPISCKISTHAHVHPQISLKHLLKIETICVKCAP